MAHPAEQGLSYSKAREYLTIALVESEMSLTWAEQVPTMSVIIRFSVYNLTNRYLVLQARVLKDTLSRSKGGPNGTPAYQEGDGKA